MAEPGGEHTEALRSTLVIIIAYMYIAHAVRIYIVGTVYNYEPTAQWIIHVHTCFCGSFDFASTDCHDDHQSQQKHCTANCMTLCILR